MRVDDIGNVGKVSPSIGFTSDMEGEFRVFLELIHQLHVQIHTEPYNWKESDLLER